MRLFVEGEVRAAFDFSLKQVLKLDVIAPALWQQPQTSRVSSTRRGVIQGRSVLVLVVSTSGNGKE